jgi:hypothetical protein
LSSAVRTVASNSLMRVSMRVVRSALAMRSWSWSADSARARIMLSRNTCKVSDIAPISSCCLERKVSVSRSPFDSSCIDCCRPRIRRRMLRPT